MSSFTVGVKEFKEAVEAVWLKGKYKSSTVSKTNVISDTICASINPNGNLMLSNANDTIAASVTIRATTQSIDEVKAIMFDIEKVMKFLKSFSGEMLKVKIGNGKILLSSENQSATVPLSVEHQNLNFIVKLNTLKIIDEQPPKFGKKELKTKLVIDGKTFSSAIKSCGSVGTAIYKLNYDGNLLTVSSRNFHNTENFSVSINPISQEGEEATVEFSAPIDKFCKDTIVIYFEDDNPILIVGPGRRLVMAPYIRVI